MAQFKTKDTVIVTEAGPPKSEDTVANSSFSEAIRRLFGDSAQNPTRGPAPVHLWNPPYCGEIDMRIGADGIWHYNGSPIRRIAMVKLFSTILRRDPERFVLVTPVERVGITVDDAPFLAVELATSPGKRRESLIIRTNVDDVVTIGREHPIRFETAADGGLKPYIHVRAGLWALASRALTHELVGRAGFETLVEQDFLGGEQPDSAPVRASGQEFFGLYSDDVFFAVGSPGDAADFR